MDFLTQISLLVVLITTIIAIALSSELSDAACVFLASPQTPLNTPSLWGLLTKTAYPLWCRQGSLQDKLDDWNLFGHLGGNGPWIEKVNARYGTYERDGEPPAGCVIDQVHMVWRIRHGPSQLDI